MNVGRTPSNVIAKAWHVVVIPQLSNAVGTPDSPGLFVGVGKLDQRMTVLSIRCQRAAVHQWRNARD